MTPLKNKKILVVDDAAPIRMFLRISLQACGAICAEAANAEQALQMSRDSPPDMIILDLGLPDQDGMDVLPQLLRDGGAFPPKVIVLTVRGDANTVSDARRLGAVAFMSKPFMMEDLLEMMVLQMPQMAH